MRMRAAAPLVVFGISMGLLAAEVDPELERLKKERSEIDARIAEREKKNASVEAYPERPRRPESRPVIVTATRLPTFAERSGFAASSVTEQEIKESGHTEAQEVLRTVPGVHIARTGTRGGTTSLFIRGGESDHNLILWDGFKVNIDGGQYDLNNLTLENVDRVEVVRGGGSSADGSYAVAGIVNLVSKRGEGPPRLVLSTEGGNLGSWRERVQLAGAQESHAYSIDAALFRQDDGRFENSDVEDRSFAGRFDFRVSRSTDAWLTLRELRYKAGVYTTSAGQRFDPPDPNDLKTRNDFLSGLTVNTRIDPGVWESRLRMFRYFHQNKLSTVADRALGPGHRDSSDSFLLTQLERGGVDWQHTVVLGDAFQVAGGAEYESESFDQASYGSSFGSDTDESRHNYAGYVEGEGNWQETAFLKASVRGDDNSDFGFRRTERISGSVLIEETDSKLRGSYGTGFKIPTFFEIHGSTSIAGLERNPEGVDVERSQTVDAGIDQNLFDRTLTIGLTGFYSKYTNFVEFLNSSYDQGARAFARGVEIETKWTPTPAWDVAASWTFLGTRVTKTKAPSETFREGDQLVRRPADSGSASVTARPFETDRLVLSVSWVYVGRRDDLDFNTWSGGLRTDNHNYDVFDAAASWKFAPGWRLFGSGQNVLNETYEEVFGFPSERASFMGGIEYTIEL